MYVDKRLSGVTAVQTLSRLNRTATPARTRTFVLDFVNDPEEILDAFQPYYRDAAPERRDRPEPRPRPARPSSTQAGIYSEPRSSRRPAAGGARQGQQRPVRRGRAGKNRFAERYKSAVASNDGEERRPPRRLPLRPHLVRERLRLPVADHRLGDVEIEKLAIYARALARLIGTTSSAPRST